MNKLTALIEVAKDAEYCKNDMRVHPATIIELCALLEKAEEALERMCIVTTSGAENGMLNMGSLEGRTTFYDLLRTEKVTATEAIAAIKQWKEQT